MRILIADDVKVIRILLTALLKKWGHEVLVADDGEQAWEILQATPVQFLISDWMMPGMDGPMLCRKIREAHFPAYVYIILLTAIGDKESIVDGIEAGADDYLAKPFNHEELRVRIDAGIRLIELESELRERNERIAAAYSTIKSDLQAAAKMQRNLLPAPSTTLGNAYFDWLFLPSLFVSGDILNYFRILDKNHVAFYLLDVSGHGVPSAMLSFTLSKVLSPDTGSPNLLKEFGGSTAGGVALVPPEKTVAELNQLFQSGATSDLYFTLVYGILNTQTGTLQFCQAGHPSPIFLPIGGSAVLLGGGGFPVGMLPDLTFETSTVQMKTGDRFFLYSDGITECANPEGEQFGDDRLINLIEAVRGLPMNEVKVAIKKVLVEWRGGEEFEDDLSLLALEMI
jgi:sigma-B regulation protein RsbU (phosphoserine phosphatase)